MQEKIAAITLLKKIEVMIAKMTWKAIAQKAAEQKIGEAAIIIGVKNVAKKLGENITRRKALAAIPIIGSGVNAAINCAFIGDIALAAIRTFQEQWLIENGKVQVNN